MSIEDINDYVGEIVEIEYYYELKKNIEYIYKNCKWEILSDAFKIGRITDMFNGYIVLNKAIIIKVSEIKTIKKYKYCNSIVNNKLITPIGEFEIYIDGVKSSYKVVPVEKTIRTNEADGIYCVKVSIEPDGNIHRISFDIKDLNKNNIDIYRDSGENVEKINYENKDIYLAICLNSENIGDETNEEYFNYYGIDYIVNDLGYELFEQTKTKEYFFGISWILGEYSDDVWLGCEANREEFYISQSIIDNGGKFKLKSENRFIYFEKGEIVKIVENKN